MPYNAGLVGYQITRSRTLRHGFKPRAVRDKTSSLYCYKSEDMRIVDDIRPPPCLRPIPNSKKTDSMYGCQPIPFRPTLLFHRCDVQTFNSNETSKRIQEKRDAR
jgi:hypothetical protein